MNALTEKHSSSYPQFEDLRVVRSSNGLTTIARPDQIEDVIYMLENTDSRDLNGVSFLCKQIVYKSTCGLIKDILKSCSVSSIEYRVTDEKSRSLTYVSSDNTSGVPTDEINIIIDGCKSHMTQTICDLLEEYFSIIGLQPIYFNFITVDSDGIKIKW